jgi:hypothetical protein
VGGVYNAVRLLSTSLIARTVCNGRTTVRRPLIDVAVNNWGRAVSLVATAMMPDYTGKDISMEYDD